MLDNYPLGDFGIKELNAPKNYPKNADILNHLPIKSTNTVSHFQTIDIPSKLTECSEYAC